MTTQALGKLLVLMLLAVQPATAGPPDWDAIAGHEVVLFRPGQSSWEWALTQSDHSGGPKIRKGKNCQGCHEGEEADITSQEGGAPATLPLEVKLAHDDERFYVRLAWPATAPGAAAAAGKPEARATLMLDDGSVKTARVAGCWGACHDDLTGMASATEGVERTKYLTTSRVRLTRSGGGDALKPAADLERQLAQGQFLEYWQARLRRGAPVVAADGRVLDRRRDNEAPAVSADASLTDDRWTVVLSRALRLGAAGRKDIVPGGRYTVGFAIHQDGHERRHHYVSMEYDFALDDGGVALGVRGK